MEKKIIIIINNKKPQAVSLGQVIHNWLRDKNVPSQICHSYEMECLTEPDFSLGVCLGGDGTVLSAARLLSPHGIPLLPINLGSFGFIGEVGADEWESALYHYFEGKLTNSSRLMLEAEVKRRDGTRHSLLALNDMVITGTGISKLVSLQVQISAKLSVPIRGDGMILSTPTGSTAYSMASGGPIVYPEIDAVILNPINPFSLSYRPMVLPASEVFTVTLSQKNNTHTVLTADGQKVINLEKDDKIKIKASPHRARIIQSDGASSFRWSIPNSAGPEEPREMLEELTISNFAIIESLQINFTEGFNVLSGETGAGKSILIGALGLLLGGKSDPSQIRSGQDESQINGVFLMEDGQDELNQWLKEHDLVPDEGRLYLRRVVRSSGRSSAYIQERSVPKDTLAELSGFLIDLHGQHDHQSLFRIARHRILLDRFGGLEDLTAEVNSLYNSLLEKKEAFDAEKERLENLVNEKEMASFALEEITKAKLTEGEEEELDRRQKVLSRSEKLISLISESHTLLSMNTDGVLISIRDAVNRLDSASAIDESLASFHSRLKAAFYEIEDIAESLRDQIEEGSYSAEELEKVDNRLALITRLEKKYGGTLEKVIAYGQECRKKLEDLETGDEHLEDLKADLAKAETRLKEKALALSTKRAETAGVLEENLIKILKSLGMNSVNFKVDLQKKEDLNRTVCGPYGIDRVEFMISANLGEPLKPLKEVASGGEISRVMLAIKSALNETDTIGTLIFDEIDAGVGGAIGRSVGRHINRLARKRQVLCITHLASIAAYADRHFRVAKAEGGGSTKTEVIRTEGEERVREIARMLSGDEQGESSLMHARSLLNEALTEKTNG